MRIDGLPSYLFQMPQAPLEQVSPAERSSVAAATNVDNVSNQYARSGFTRPGVIVDISPEAKAAYEQSQQEQKVNRGEKSPLAGTGECQTCKNRKYQDQSDDSSVSFQSPTHLSPAQAPTAVLSHEREHVTNEQAKADKEGRRVISQTVTLQTSFCPECGRMYVSGGTTRTITAKDNSIETPEPDAKVPEAAEGSA